MLKTLKYHISNFNLLHIHYDQILQNLEKQQQQTQSECDRTFRVSDVELAQGCDNDSEICS